jgi:hypothetical protein
MGAVVAVELNMTVVVWWQVQPAQEAAAEELLVMLAVYNRHRLQDKQTLVEVAVVAPEMQQVQMEGQV